MGAVAPPPNTFCKPGASRGVPIGQAIFPLESGLSPAPEVDPFSIIREEEASFFWEPHWYAINLIKNVNFIIKYQIKNMQISNQNPANFAEQELRHPP